MNASYSTDCFILLMDYTCDNGRIQKFEVIRNVVGIEDNKTRKLPGTALPL